MTRYLYKLLIEPTTTDPDSRRRERLLNILLTGLLGTSIVAFFVSTVAYIVIVDLRRPENVYSIFAFALMVLILLIISRKGRPKISAFLFMAFLQFVSVSFVLAWSVRLAVAELFFALTIVIAGVLFTAPLALVVTLASAACLLVVGWLQLSGTQVPYLAWEADPLQASDVIGYIAMFILIGLVSWLSNRETDRSLVRARRSEKALAKERDNLEIKVVERTRELEDLQAARLLELQPFAEFGRIGANLVHEIANPLTAASLNLEELNRQQHSELVMQVQRNLHHLEKYLVAARKQIRRESDLRVFAVGAEIKQIVHLLRHRAQRAEVRLEVKNVSRVKLYGDAVKFDQLVANLLANAIDAYQKLSKPQQVVTLTAEAVNGGVRISITDHGVGISTQQKALLFEPFYSTKSSPRSGLGLGLALVKQYVEHDFKGSIDVQSSPETGTTFTVLLKGQIK